MWKNPSALQRTMQRPKRQRYIKLEAMQNSIGSAGLPSLSSGPLNGAKVRYVQFEDIHMDVSPRVLQTRVMQCDRSSDQCEFPSAHTKQKIFCRGEIVSITKLSTFVCNPSQRGQECGRNAGGTESFQQSRSAFVVSVGSDNLS